MLNDYDRYTLAMAVLSGEKDAHKVLADLLEEAGDRGSAMGAGPQVDARTPAGFCLGHPAGPIGMGLACDFIRHLFLDLSEKRRDRKPVLKAVDVLGQWCLGQQTDDQMVAACVSLTNISSRVTFWFSPLESLVEAALNAQSSLACHRQGEQANAARYAEAARVGIRRIAKLTQRGGQAPGDLNPRPNERAWQTERVQVVLSDLIRAAS